MAKYQNGQWTSLLSGITGTVRSFAVADFSGAGGPGASLYAATDSGGGGSVYRWTGTQWAVVSGLSGISYSLLSYADSDGPVLLTAGYYGVMGWRGNGTWTPYGQLSVSSGAVMSLRVIDDGSGPSLFAVGSFIDTQHNIRRAAKFMAGQWTQYALPSAGQISDITVFDDGTGPTVYLAGAIDTGYLAARLVSGQWQYLPPNGVSSGVGLGPWWQSVRENGADQLYLMGNFSTTTPTSSGILRWTAGGWQVPFLAFPNDMKCAIRYDDGGGEQTYFGGDMGYATLGPQEPIRLPANGLVRWPGGGAPRTLDMGFSDANPSATSAVYDLATLEVSGAPCLVAAGPILFAGGSRAFGAAMYDGASWTPLSLASPAQWAQSPALVTINGQVRVAAIVSSGGPVATWDGTHWVGLLPSQPSGAARLLNYDDELGHTLYALSSIGVFRYTGSTWQRVSNLTYAACAASADLGSGRRLYIGGANASGAGIFEWDGTTTTRVGAAFSPSPTALIAHSDPGATPSTTLVTSVPNTQGPLRWNGASWEVLGQGIFGSVSLASYDDGQGPAVYACGPFYFAGGVSCPGLARFRNNQWSPVTPPVSPAHPPSWTSMAIFQGKLYIAGAFTSIGNLVGDHLIVLEPCAPTCTADFNGDGDSGTDADIEAFFACLAGTCCPRCASPDFNNDGDSGTDGDIESFFRVLAGAAC